MSKNVAVFVDVANIFYAAKAAGVDIDYVTLLKSAIAGRDFVRAYAYTGLDPENENQRQFHAFLARSGYKVVSKDIRKYGDGKVKANLDIELVVDLMKTARNLDIAVIVSGDGDFAPAIRAVQETGVRCEVISFRGNTSSDLIEVADVFTDITQIARVEKGSSRSGRRVAAEDDLSMTEVPDKETEGAPRRRRRRATAEREEGAGRRTAEPVAVESAARSGGNLIVLPGEKLSRVAGGEVSDEEATAGEEATAEAAEPTALSAVGEGPEGAETRRRRRRRGGRGRGRGRGAEREPLTSLEGGLSAAEDEEEGVEYEAPRIPQHSTFGSVWDTQLGVPTAPVVASGEVSDEEYEDEPEIPEYLLAERRQRTRGPVRGGARPGGGGRGRGGAYQAAVERERYGRGASSGSGMSGGVPGAGYRGPRRDDRSRGRGGQPRPDRPPRADRPPAPVSSGGDPWSEVPPELEELLRAELARKGGTAGGGPSAAEPLPGPVEAAETAEAEAPAVEAAPKPRRRTTRKAAEPAAGAEPTVTVEAATEADEAKPKRRTTRRAAAATGPATAEAGAAEAESAPKPRRRSTRASSTAAPAEAGGEATIAEGGETAAEKPKRRTTRRTSSTTGSGES